MGEKLSEKMNWSWGQNKKKGRDERLRKREQKGALGERLG